MSNPAKDPRDFLPLSPQTFQILLALHDEPKHGYAIITDVRERTGDEMKLTASTLYDALARLLDSGLIQENFEHKTRSADAAPPDARRRYYELTSLGREVAQAEVNRLERLLRMARDKRLVKTRG